MGFVGNYISNLASLAVGREPSRPLLFSYYVTHRCGLSCVYCCDGQGRPFKKNVVAELPTAGAKELITLLARSSAVLDITGGEPMVRQDLETILDHARSSGMCTVLNTKGLGLADRPDLMRLANVLVLSVDSLDATRLGHIAGSGTAMGHGILRALEYALATRGTARTQVVVSAVVLPDNIADVEDVLELAIRHGLGFHLSPEIQGVNPNPALRNNPDYVHLIDRALKAKKAGHAILGVSEYYVGIRAFAPFRCHPLLMPAIQPDGRLLYPCLEAPVSRVDILQAGSYRAALDKARSRCSANLPCDSQCHIFCHMGLSMLQRYPVSALRENRCWTSIRTTSIDVRVGCNAEERISSIC